MPMQDFLAGMALFALMLALVGLATALVVRRRLDHLDRLELAMASVVVGTAILTAVHLVPLMLAILTRGTVIAAALLAAGLAALVRPAAPRATDPGDPSPAADRPAPPGSRQASWALAALAGAFAAVTALADLGRWAGDELVGVDPLTFHLPNVGRWIQDHSMWQIDQFVPLLAHGNYPNNGDVVLLSTVIPWHNDFLVRLPITFFLVTTAVAVFAVARELRAPLAASALAAAALVSLPVVGIATIPRALPDALMWTTFACGVLFLLRHARSRRRSDLVLAGIALGIAAGTKWYGVSSVAAVGVVWAGARLLADRTRRRSARGDGASPPVGPAVADIAIVGGLSLLGTLPWLLRNLLLSDNPVFPLKVSPFGITIFDAPPDVIRDQAGFTIADYAGDASVLGQLAGEIVEGLGIVPILCGLALALGPRAGAAPRARRFRPARARARRDRRRARPAVHRHPRDGARPARRPLARARQHALRRAGTAHRAADRRLGGGPPAARRRAAVRGRARRRGTDRRLPRLRGRRPARHRACRRRPRRARGRRLAALAPAGAPRRARRWPPSRPRWPGSPPHTGSKERSTTAATGASTAPWTRCCASAPGDQRIGLAADWSVGGLSPVWPAFGTRIGNDVEYVGEFVDGFLTPYRSQARFQEALRHGAFDLLVVGRGFYPPQDTPEQRWAMNAGWRTIGLSPRLRVLAAPAPPRPQPQGGHP